VKIPFQCGVIRYGIKKATLPSRFTDNVPYRKHKKNDKAFKRKSYDKLFKLITTHWNN